MKLFLEGVTLAGDCVCSGDAVGTTVVARGRVLPLSIEGLLAAVDPVALILEIEPGRGMPVVAAGRLLALPASNGAVARSLTWTSEFCCEDLATLRARALLLGEKMGSPESTSSGKSLLRV